MAPGVGAPKGTDSSEISSSATTAETVRKVLRHFHGRVLLADEVGLGKTIEACLLLREYLLRGMVRRVLILVPAPLVSQWHEELIGKFDLEFTIPKGASADRAEFWTQHDRVLASLAFAKSKKHAPLVAGQPWDLVIVDEAHHCKNPATLNWQLVNALQRRFMFLLSATLVQNNLLELYNLLTLLLPGHLRTEADFKKQYVKRGNSCDARNRERLRSLLGEVMVRNSRGLVQLQLPPRYAQTILARLDEAEAQLYRRLTQYLRQRGCGIVSNRASDGEAGTEEAEEIDPETAVEVGNSNGVSRLQLSSLLAAQGSHPAAVASALERNAAADPEARELAQQAAAIGHSAKDARLLDLVEQSLRRSKLRS